MECVTCLEQSQPANSLTASCKVSRQRLISSFRTTSVNQTRELEEALNLLPPVNEDSVKCWCDLHSLEALRLSLPQIIESCKLPNQHVLEEYPFAKHVTPLGTIKKIPTPSPLKPQAHLDKDKLYQKRRQLKLLVKFYENRICTLCNGSNRYFGVVKGSKVALLIEASDKLASAQDGKKFEEYKNSLKFLVEEQLVSKEAVYFIQFGTAAIPQHPEPVPFEINRSQCKKFSDQWLTALEGRGGCSLLSAVKVALALEQVETICIALSTQPDQDLSIIHHHLTDRLTGYRSPKVHLVAFESPQEICSSLSEMAQALKGHFHSYSSLINSISTDSTDEHKTFSVEDTDIDHVKKEIEKTKQVIHDLHNLQEGVVRDPLLSVLRELSLTTEWEKDDDFSVPAPPTAAYSLPISSLEWLEKHGINYNGLDLYQVLAPNAYPQLDGHVKITDEWVLSQVYDVMPLFPWHDGTHKYLHVDVHGLENYIRLLETFIADILTPRMSWLLSGSRMPFGVLTEDRVVVVLDNSFQVLAQVLVLQQHLKTLLEEQLSLVKEFNLVRFGKECCYWTTGFAEPSKHSLREAWEFVLGVSPSGTCNLLSALRMMFETEVLFDGGDGEEVGIYLVVASMPDQDEDQICSYLEQQLAGREVKVHIIYYDMEHLSHNLVVPGRDGGKYASSEEVEECLRTIARSTKGRFHHFKVSGSADSDDMKVLLAEISLAHRYLETANNILEHYREFCKRNMPVLESTLTSPKHVKPMTPPPPVYPRQTTSSLARMNTCQKRLRSTSLVDTRTMPQGDRRKGGKRKPRLKTQPFYTGEGLNKAVALDLLDRSSAMKTTKSLIPNKEVYSTSKQWLSKYGIEALGLSFEDLLPAPNKIKAQTYHQHVSHKGEQIALCVDHQGLKKYLTQLLKVVNRYQNRVEWLQRDEHKCFGAITESKVVIILDASSSMAAHWSEMKQGVLYLTQRFPPHIKSFNLITYSSIVKKWKDKSIVPDRGCLDDLMLWLDTINPGGSSCLLEAFKAALLSGAEGIYLVTDGEADHTHQFLVDYLPKLRQQFGDLWRLNSVAFYCTNEEPVTFLKTLSKKTGGRYHCYPQISLGDDMTLIEHAVQTAQKCISQARNIL